MLPSSSGILAKAVNTEILTKNRPDSPHSHPHSLHSHPDSPHSHPDSPHSHPDFPCFHPDSTRFHHTSHSVPHFPIPAFTDSQANLRVNTEKSKLYFNLIQKLICEFVVNLIKKWNCIANGKVFTLKNILHYNWVELGIFIQYLVISKLLSYQFFRVILTRNL